MIRNYDTMEIKLGSPKTWNFPREQPAEVDLKGPFEHCRDCNMAANGFICWSKDGTCMKTQYRKGNPPVKKD